MSNLSGFFAQNKVKKENVFYTASDSFLDGQGEPLKWELKAITSKEDSKIRQICTTQKQIKGKKNQFTRDFNSELYMAKLAAACIVFPDLLNAELQDSYGVKNEIDLLEIMLSPGERTNLSEKISELCGFDVEIDELVEEVKN